MRILFQFYSTFVLFVLFGPREWRSDVDTTCFIDLPARLPSLGLLRYRDMRGLILPPDQSRSEPDGSLQTAGSSRAAGGRSDRTFPLRLSRSAHMLRQNVKVTGSTIDSNNTTVMHRSHTTNSGLCRIPSGGFLPLVPTINVCLYQTTADELLGRTPVLYACHYYSVETSCI